MNRKLLKSIYLVLAFVFCGLGLIGVVIPVLPTTPFLLLASFFFARGSERFHRWFLSTKLYQNHLQKFKESKGMTLKTKFYILIPASIMLSIAFIVCPIWHGRVLIAAVFLFKYYYFFAKIKTLAKDNTVVRE